MTKSFALTALQVKRLSTPGRYCDGEGLWLYIGKRGGKSWVLRYRSPIDGKPHTLGLGSTRLVQLAEAREQAREIRRSIMAGNDPLVKRVERRRQAKAEAVQEQRKLTFDECADAYIRSHRAGWKNPKHADQWANTLAMYASPVFGAMPVDKIDVGLVMKVLEPI